MALARERLESIDRELEALGKSDDELDVVIRRARSLFASLEDVDAALHELAEGREVAVAAAEAPRPTSGLDAYGDAFMDSEPPSAKLAPPASAPPPDFDDDNTDIRHVSEVPPAARRPPTRPPPAEPPPSEPRRSSDIAGLSVDELFADADPSDEAAPLAEPSGLADLFDDSPFGHSEPDSGLASLEDALEGAEPEAPVEASNPMFAEALPAFGDEDEGEESTHVLGADDLAGMMALDSVEIDEFGDSDDFELLVDEDVLVLEADDEEGEHAEEPADGDEKQTGLISRLLGRK